MQTSPRQCHLHVAPIFSLMDFTCTTEQENINWSQKSCFSWALLQQDRNPPQSRSISQGAANPPAGGCQPRSSGRPRPAWPGGAGADCCWLSWSWGALAAFPSCRPGDPIPGTAQTLLAALTWAHQGAELCLCVLQSRLSGDERDGG